MAPPLPKVSTYKTRNGNNVTDRLKKEEHQIDHILNCYSKQ